jgi:hypothetical protein
VDSTILTLSKRQLDAYNRADLDAFCACYHPEVEILDEQGRVLSRGLEEFRARYRDRFGKSRDVHAVVHARMELGEHIVEHETWSRVDRATGAAESGDVLVRYSEQDGLIRYAQFFKAR